MDIAPVLAIAAVTVAGLMTGCSGQSADSGCDVQGVTDDIAHMVEESSLSLESLDSLTCSGDWAVAEVTVSGGGEASDTATFILQNAGNGWILKAPEIACVGDEQVDSIPEELRELACAEV